MHSNPFRLFSAAILAAVSLHVSAFGEVHSGTVLETMDSGGYTYMKVDSGSGTFWAAAPAARVAVGEQVSFTEQMRMQDFTSNTLQRTFDELMFVSDVKGAGGAHGSAPKAGTPMAVMEPIARAEGGITIADVYEQKEALKGKRIKVRGRVMKVSRNIMGQNWIHLEDGTGHAEQRRVIFRSPTALAEVGRIVTAEGVLDTDRDFGFSYQYSVLVENARFTE